jgi:hypothetical protein
VSGALTALSAAATFLEVTDVLLLRRPRGISGPWGIILPDCVIEETSRDDVQVTEHPVEIGTVIADHAYKKPREVTLRWSWSNSGYYETRVQDVYQQLLALQGPPPSLISITTGKSLYLNMLVISLGITTNSASEYALQAVMVCREVIIVSTEAAQITPASAQSSPQTTAAVAQRGAVQPQQQASTFAGSLQTEDIIARGAT